jgi:hypothetical protein
MTLSRQQSAPSEADAEKAFNSGGREVGGPFWSELSAKERWRLVRLYQAGQKAALALQALDAGQPVLVALNAAGEERAMCRMSPPWPIAEFVEMMQGWQEADPARVVSFRPPSVPADKAEPAGWFWRWANSDEWRMLSPGVSDAGRADFIRDQERIAPIVVAPLYPAPAPASSVEAQVPISVVRAAFMEGRESMLGTDRHHGDRAWDNSRAKSLASKSGQYVSRERFDGVCREANEARAALSPPQERVEAVDCKHCQGTGYIEAGLDSMPCAYCLATGKVTQ